MAASFPARRSVHFLEHVSDQVPIGRLPQSPSGIPIRLASPRHRAAIGDLIEAALKVVPTKPTPTPAQRRRSFRVIQGDLFD